MVTTVTTQIKRVGRLEEHGKHWTFTDYHGNTSTAEHKVHPRYSHIAIPFIARSLCDNVKNVYWDGCWCVEYFELVEPVIWPRVIISDLEKTKFVFQSVSDVLPDTLVSVRRNKSFVVGRIVGIFNDLPIVRPSDKPPNYDVIGTTQPCWSLK